MSYAGLGQADTTIHVGELAKTDPFVSKASLMASNVMKKMATLPLAKRRVWLRSKLNGLWPDMGNEVMESIAKISETKPRDQAIFDAIRLALANRMVSWAAQQATKQGTSGLGDLATDARTFACTSASLSATAGGFVGAFRPGADTSIIGGAQAGAGISNCNLEALQLQAQIAAQQANAAAAAASGANANASRTVLYAGLGVVGIIGMAIAAKVILK